MGGMCANVGVSGCRWWHRAYARVYIQSCGRGVASPIRVAVTWPCAVRGGVGLSWLLCGVVCQSWCVVAQVCDVECGWLKFLFPIFLIENILVKPLFGI